MFYCLTYFYLDKICSAIEYRKVEKKTLTYEHFQTNIKNFWRRSGADTLYTSSGSFLIKFRTYDVK